jgi:hypothetical protein
VFAAVVAIVGVIFIAELILVASLGLFTLKIPPRLPPINK